MLSVRREASSASLSCGMRVESAMVPFLARLIANAARSTGGGGWGGRRHSVIEMGRRYVEE